MIIAPPLMMIPTAASSPPAPLALVQYASASVASTAAIGVNWPAPTTNGNLLVALIGTRTSTTNSGAPPTVSGGGFTQVLTAWSTIAMGRWYGGAHGYIANAASQSGTVTFTTNAAALPAGMTAVIAEYSGVVTSSPLDQATSSVALGSPWATQSITNSQAAEVIVCGAFGGSAGITSSTATNNFVIETQATAAAPSISFLDLATSSTFTGTCGATATASPLNAIMVSYK